MKTIAKIILFQLMIIFSFVANGQNGTGLNFNSEEYDQLPLTPEFGTGEKSIGNLKDNKKDLSIYAPRVINQGKANSCVAWSTAYYAYTIQRAIQEGITDKSQINTIALSAMYPYKSLTEQFCNIKEKNSLPIEAVAEFMRANGNILYGELPTNSCDESSITAQMRVQAKRYIPIKGYQSVFNTNTTPLNRRNLIINEIDKNNRPVIVGMSVFLGNLEKLTASDDYYYPSKGGKELVTHAMTVVGYDIYKQAFKILNSWGPNFGQEGYFWMKFTDFDKHILCAITLNLSDVILNNSSNSKKIEVGGKFGFLYLNNVSEKFEPSEIPFHKSNGLYELNKKNWKVGQYFQLATDNAKSGQSVCVFSIDKENKVTLHWPYNESEKGSIDENPNFGMTVSDQMPTRNYKMIIPGEDKALVIEKAGTDYLCVLYSENTLIQDIKSILKNIEANANTNIVARIQNALGERLINPSEVNYQKSGMSFTANATKGDTVPLILKIESVN